MGQYSPAADKLPWLRAGLCKDGERDVQTNMLAVRIILPAVVLVKLSLPLLPQSSCAKAH